MRRAVVTGASGLLGGAVLAELETSGLVVEGWSRTVERTPAGVPLRRLDLTEESAAAAALADARPDLVVHCAALTDVDGCEDDPTAAQALNADAAGALARAAKGIGARLVSVSTDAVYDGERPGPHAEDEAPGPVNAYARTKLEGEAAVRRADPAALVMRTTLHGWTASGRLSFSEAILRNLLAENALRLFTDVRFSVLPVTDLARLLRALAATDVRGVLNVGAADAVDKHSFGHLVARTFGLDPSPIEPIRLADLGLRAARPRDCALDVTRLIARLGTPPPTVLAGVHTMRAELESGAVARLKGRAAGSGLADLLDVGAAA